MADDGTDSELAGLPQRVAALETQVVQLTQRVRGTEQDAAAARVLAGAADRDVADLRQAFTAQRHVLQALRETQLEQGKEMRERFAEVDRGFADVRGRLDATAAGQQHIVDLLTTLIDREPGSGQEPT